LDFVVCSRQALPVHFCGRPSSAFLPHLVPRETVLQGITWSSGSFHLSSVAGPAAGGALIALTGHAAIVYGVNAVASFSASFCLARTPPSYRRCQRKDDRRSLIAGFKFVFNSKIILATITLDLFAVLLGGATALLRCLQRHFTFRPQRNSASFKLRCRWVRCSARWCSRIGPVAKSRSALLWAVAGFGLATIGIGLSHWFGSPF